MKINVSKPYIASFGKVNEQPPKTQIPKDEEDSFNNEIKEACKAVRIILNPSQDANLTCTVTESGEKHISVAQGGKLLSISKFAKGVGIPYEIEEGFDEEKKLIKKRTIYKADGTIDAVQYGIHTDTSNIDKKVTYDKYGLPQFTFENINIQKGTIDKVTELFCNSIPLSINYDIDMKRCTTRRKETYYEDGKTPKIVQENCREKFGTGLIKIERETQFNKDGKKRAVFDDITEIEPGHLSIVRFFLFGPDGETVSQICENAIQVDGRITDYSKLTLFEMRNGTLYEITSTKTEQGYETNEKKAVFS